MPRRRDIDWPAVFAHMESTGMGPRPTARHFGIAPGSVLAAVARRRQQEAQAQAVGATEPGPPQAPASGLR